MPALVVVALLTIIIHSYAVVNKSENKGKIWDVAAAYFIIQRTFYAAMKKYFFDKVRVCLAVVAKLLIKTLRYVAMEELVHWWKAIVLTAVALCPTVIAIRYAVMIMCLTGKTSVTHAVVAGFTIRLPKSAVMEKYAKQKAES